MRRHFKGHCLFGILALALLAPFAVCARGGSHHNIHVYLDTAGNVHLVSARGVDRRISSGGNAIDPMLSDDGKTVVWRRRTSVWPPDPDHPDSVLTDAAVVYRSGLRRVIKGGCPFVTELWFWKSGRYLGLRCAGLHLAGYQKLYDISTLGIITSFDESVVRDKERPDWSIDNINH